MATPRENYRGTLQRSTDPDGSVYETIGKVREAARPEVTRDTIDVTDTQHEGYMEYIPVPLRDVGEIEFTVMYDYNDSIHAKLKADMDADQQYRASHNWRFVNRDGVVAWQAMGFVVSVGEETPRDDAHLLTFSIKITGKPTRVFQG